MDSVKDKLDRINRTVLSHSGGGPQFKAVYVADLSGHVATGDSVIDHIIASAGAVNVAESLTGWKADNTTLSQPEYIFCPKSLAEKVRSIDGLKNSPAVKNNRIFEIEAEYIESQGFRMIEAAEIIAKPCTRRHSPNKPAQPLKTRPQRHNKNLCNGNACRLFSRQALPLLYRKEIERRKANKVRTFFSC